MRLRMPEFDFSTFSEKELLEERKIKTEKSIKQSSMN